MSLLLMALAVGCEFWRRQRRRVEWKRSQFRLSLWLLLLGNTASGQSIIIGYADCMAVTNYSPSLMSRITQLNWYFAHASVGQCMMEGLTNLHLADPAFYELQSLLCSSNPPPSTANGIIYNDERGHVSAPNFAGDWQWSDAYFEGAVSNGWHYPAVNVCMDILSFVDIWYNSSSNGVAELLGGYVNSKMNLEAAYPQTIFVYTTMPITTTNYSYEIDQEPQDSYWRNVFNESLRAWCRSNNRVLFDLADIEAHDTNGALSTFNYGGQAVEVLWFGDNQGGDMGGGEIGDGAHPTNFGAEELMAKGFYALSAALVSATPASSTTTVASSANPSFYGQSMTFTATVHGSNTTPAGAIQFLTNGAAAGSPISLANSTAVFTTAALRAGTNVVSATYSGDINFSGSSNSLAQIVMSPSNGAVQKIIVSGTTAVVTFSGTPNSSYSVQRSTNVSGNWVTLLNTNVPSGGSFECLDNFQDLGIFPASAFYRLKQP